MFSRKQLFLAKTSYFSQTIHYKHLKLHAMIKLLQNTFTYQVWFQSDKKWWFCNTFLYFVFIDHQQNALAKIDKLNCFTDEFNLFVYAQNKVKYLPSSNKPRVRDQIWRILITFSNVRHVVFTKCKKCYKIIILCRIESKFGKWTYFAILFTLQEVLGVLNK